MARRGSCNATARGSQRKTRSQRNNVTAIDNGNGDLPAAVPQPTPAASRRFNPYRAQRANVAANAAVTDMSGQLAQLRSLAESQQRALRANVPAYADANMGVTRLEGWPTFAQPTASAGPLQRQMPAPRGRRGRGRSAGRSSQGRRRLLPASMEEQENRGAPLDRGLDSDDDYDEEMRKASLENKKEREEKERKERDRRVRIGERMARERFEEEGRRSETESLVDVYERIGQRLQAREANRLQETGQEERAVVPGETLFAPQVSMEPTVTEAGHFPVSPQASYLPANIPQLQPPVPPPNNYLPATIPMLQQPTPPLLVKEEEPDCQEIDITRPSIKIEHGKENWKKWTRKQVRAFIRSIEYRDAKEAEKLIDLNLNGFGLYYHWADEKNTVNRGISLDFWYEFHYHFAKIVKELERLENENKTKK
ncbi:hypothetical protein GCK72_025921 [Caenorhabditis remanei]|uniref:Uncharacterized protein n=1 Tax=Caenorhabditis remanei TaxID=31234 RepID=A0A6A5G3R6_CAERE|nr:hypothetical protein GCK72_025921 [Caenorhabditis remanei]KAF1749453.1 hypothetical protein GCK72_025921 [Caenorhabditis remanei]